MNLDALDIGPGPLIDHEINVDASCRFIPADTRRGLREG